MAYEIQECPYCRYRRAVRTSPSLIDFEVPVTQAYASGIAQHVTKVCSRPGCQRVDQMVQFRDRLIGDMQLRAERVYFVSQPPPSTGVLGSGLLGDALKYLQGPPRHVPHTRLLMPSDEALIAELNEWQARDGWQPPRA